MARRKKVLFRNELTRDLVADFLLALILGMVCMAVFWLLGGLLVPDAKQCAPTDPQRQVQPFLAVLGATLPIMWKLMGHTAAKKLRIAELVIWVTLILLFGSLLFSGKLSMADAYQEAPTQAQESSAVE